MKRRRRISNRSIKKIARERIEHLLELAKAVFSKDSNLAQRYIQLALRIGMRHKVRIPRFQRWQICKHCRSLLIPDVTCHSRLRNKREPHIVITCNKCKNYNRYPYNVKKQR
ncbi:MAG: ribonuclease P protein component 4 [Promethearchaeota archaeon]